MNATSRANGTERARIVRRIQRLTRLMDTAFRIPIINYRIGLDPIIGLIPGAGDTVTLAISAYIVWQARRLGASGKVLKRMIANIALDLLFGVVPIVGDVADMVYKSNVRNLRLLEKIDPEEFVQRAEISRED